MGGGFGVVVVGGGVGVVVVGGGVGVVVVGGGVGVVPVGEPGPSPWKEELASRVPASGSTMVVVCVSIGVSSQPVMLAPPEPVHCTRENVPPAYCARRFTRLPADSVSSTSADLSAALRTLAAARTVNNPDTLVSRFP